MLSGPVGRVGHFGGATVLLLAGIALTSAMLCAEQPPAPSANAQPSTDSDDQAAPSNMDPAELLKQLDRLVEQNEKLQQENTELMQQIRQMRDSLRKQVAAPPPQNNTQRKTQANPQPVAQDNAQSDSGETAVRSQAQAVPQPKPGQAPGDVDPNQPKEVIAKGDSKFWSAYTPNFGYKVANTEHGDLSVSIFTYTRYINQRALDNTFTNAFGNISNVQQRQDAQLNKLQIKFLGWVMSPKLRYFLYAWTNNANQGGQFYIALAGYTGFNFNKHFSLWGGLNALPGTRSVEGNFPFWLGVDSRHIADEFFRPSYTSGIWAKGEIVKKLNYHVMVGNNLSTLGVTASQFNQKFNTTAAALIWMPTTGEFGPGFGDFENHQDVATRLGVHFTRSDENKESQPNTEGFENTQIRLSDGSIIFTPNLFGPGVTIDDVRYRMSSFDGGIKYKGMSLEGEYFLRWLDNFQGTNVALVPDQFDHGFQIQASAMVVPKTLQFYVGGSKIFGNFGDPFDTRIGANWFPFKNRVLRWNSEALYLDKSPVGYTAVPFTIGGKGWVFHTNVELAF